MASERRIRDAAVARGHEALQRRRTVVGKVAGPLRRSAPRHCYFATATIYNVSYIGVLVLFSPGMIRGDGAMRILFALMRARSFTA